MLNVKRTIVLAIGIILISICIGFLLVKKDMKTSQQYDVAATIYPLYDITKIIAGDDLSVGLILPPGSSPHTYEPTPSDIRNLQSSTLVFAIGHDLDDWSETIIDSTHAERIIVDANIDLHEFDEVHEDEADHAEEADEHDHEGIDPHYWLSFENTKIIAQTITTELSTEYPEHAERFETRLQAYIAVIEQTKQQAERLIATRTTTDILTLHDAWNYFAEELGLTIVETFEPIPGKEPTAKDLLALTNVLATYDIHTLFSEPQLDTSGLESFAKDNDLQIISIDPIGGIDDNSHIETLLQNARYVAEHR